MELNQLQIDHVVLLLHGADGEDVHIILKKSNWSEQILKQLIMTENIETVEYWYQQRKAMEEEATEKLNAIQLTGQTEYKTVIFEFSTRENDYTVIYNEDGGNLWNPVWDIRCDGDEVEEDEIREKLISLAKKSMNLID